MSLLKFIRRLIRSDNYTIDEPPLYEDENPPEYDFKHEENNDTKLINEIEMIINNIRNNKYKLNGLLLDNNEELLSNIIKYLVENNPTTNDIMVYMISNHKHNHNVRIGENKIILDNNQNKIFIVGPTDLNIYINEKVLNFSKYDYGFFGCIFINESGWTGNAIHHIGSFNDSNFIKLF